MRLIASIVALGLLPLLPSQGSGDEGLRVVIEQPQNGGSVVHRDYVSGTVSNAAAQVWVVIHPMETSDYWIQPSVTVKDDGTWRVKAYFGDPPSNGKEFEVRAFANPRTPLSEGRSDTWPAADAKSNVVDVVRK